MKCPNCGSVILDSAMLCRACGMIGPAKTKEPDKETEK